CYRLHSQVLSPTVISYLSLHDALPIYEIVIALHQFLHLFHRFRLLPLSRHHLLEDLHTRHLELGDDGPVTLGDEEMMSGQGQKPDRKSTRVNYSHSQISYAVFCLKTKK